MNMAMFDKRLPNSANARNTRANNAFQDRLSRTAHQREVKDLKSAGLNPILSAKGSGAPQPSSAAAKVEPLHLKVGEKLVQAQQIKLLEAQSRKTRAEAINTELQEPYNSTRQTILKRIISTSITSIGRISTLITKERSGHGSKSNTPRH
jgi:hypothetical protein